MTFSVRLYFDEPLEKKDFEENPRYSTGFASFEVDGERLQLSHFRKEAEVGGEKYVFEGSDFETRLLFGKEQERARIKTSHLASVRNIPYFMNQLLDAALSLDESGSGEEGIIRVSCSSPVESSSMELLIEPIGPEKARIWGSRAPVSPEELDHKIDVRTIESDEFLQSVIELAEWFLSSEVHASIDYSGNPDYESMIEQKLERLKEQF